MESYIGEIKLFAGTFAPVDWAFCDGSLLDISTYEPLFALLGTTYGGDGQRTFALPDLRGRVPVHAGPGYARGQAGGAETVTLQPANFPKHTHIVHVSDDAATLTDPEGALLAETDGIPMYTPAIPSLTMHARTISGPVVPGTGVPYGQPSPVPHETMQPFQCINYIICLNGIYPNQR